MFDIWVNKIKSMEEVEIKECSYNMEVLLGKNCQDPVCIDDDLYLFINEWPWMQNVYVSNKEI